MNNTKSDRDRSIEHLLRDALVAPTSLDTRGTCLDAEIAAAFVENALSPVERSAAVVHAAGCTRCQALLAAVAKTTPPATAASWWRLPAAGWLAPLSAAAAAGVIIWAVLPDRARLLLPNSSPAPSASLVVPAPVGPAVSPEAPRRFEAVPEERAKRQVAATGAAATIAGTPPVPRDTQEATRERPAASPGGGALASTPAQAFADASNALAPPAAPAAPAAAAAQATLRRAQTAGRPNGAFALAEKAAPSGTVIVSPDASSVWRILSGGAVQRSLDGGSTWQGQQTGVTVTLTAGASPSPSVCWLVGPGGTVLLSTDGRQWRRVPFPEMTDLVSVRATDEHATTVTTSDGRTFLTKDGGLTWMRSPGA